MATSDPSPVSDESSYEELHRRDLVTEAIAHDQPTAMSPRSALLAHTSLREHSAAEPMTTVIEPSRTRRRNSGSERRRKRERDLVNATPSQRELVRLLIDQEQEASILRKKLYIANQRVDSETRRAAELERANQHATQRYHEVNESRVVVQKEASKAIQDSRVYHLELENAQKEIEMARESLKRIENERDEAEAAAARARAKTRKLREQQIVGAAREEGRRLGFEAGFEHARQERLLIAARPHNTTSRRNPRSSNRDVAKSHSPPDSASGRNPNPSNRDVTRPYSPSNSTSRRNPDSSDRDVTRPYSPSTSASRRNPHSTDTEVVNKPYFPPSHILDQRSMQSSNPQDEDEAALRRSRLLDDLGASPAMSAFDLPIRNLPPTNPSVTSPIMPANVTRTPLRPFQPPPESTTYESRPHTPTPPTSPPPAAQAQEPPLQLADRTPSIHYFKIDIPDQEVLSREEYEREYNTKENPNDIIKQMPREGWVTAAKHREIKGSPPAPYPGSQPPPLLPALYPQPTNVRPARPPKIVRFPSLAKTRQQAASWYRSFSFRKKNRPVIDPIDEPVQNPTTIPTPTSATSNKGKAPEPNSASIESGDPHAQFGAPPQPSQSWYRKSAPSSIHTTDAKRRPISGVESSPGLSQFELLFTPHVGTNSVKSGKEGKRVKEKDSYLSVINEETPTNDRFLTASSSRTVAVPRPSFIAAEQKGSYGAFGSSSSRHQLAIVVPDPDAPLPPPGIAYSQPVPSKSQVHPYPMEHKASQSSSQTAASIGIEVVPPSGFAPDPVQSPPHTGRTHLSPYHVFGSKSHASSSRTIPMPSITSLQDLVDKQLEPPPPLPVESRSGSRASSRRADNGRPGSNKPRSVASRPQSAMSAALHGSFMVNKSVEDARSSRSRTPRAPTPAVLPRETQPSRPQSSASKTQLSVLNLNTTPIGQQTPKASSSALNLVPPVHHSTSRVSMRATGSFSNGFDEGAYLDPAFFPSDRPANGNGHHHQTEASAQQQQQPQPQPSSSALNLVPPVRHSTSRVSLRQSGSFANGFDDGTYLDPAFYPGEEQQMHLTLQAPSRPVSRASSSGLSYV